MGMHNQSSKFLQSMETLKRKLTPRKQSHRKQFHNSNQRKQSPFREGSLHHRLVVTTCRYRHYNDQYCKIPYSCFSFHNIPLLNFKAYSCIYPTVCQEISKRLTCKFYQFHHAANIAKSIR